MGGRALSPQIRTILDKVLEAEKDRTLSPEEAMRICNCPDAVKVKDLSERMLLQYALLIAVDMIRRLEKVYEMRAELAQRGPNRAQRRWSK